MKRSTAKAAGFPVEKVRVRGTYLAHAGVCPLPRRVAEAVAGVARDARRLDLGNGQPVAAADRPAFDAERSRLAALLHPAPVSPLAQLGD